MGEKKKVNDINIEVLSAVVIMLSLSMTVLGMSGGGGDLGYGQTCDALNLCPENPLRGVMIPTVSLLLSFFQVGKDVDSRR